jgi:hypothetical protein
VTSNPCRVTRDKSVATLRGESYISFVRHLRTGKRVSLRRLRLAAGPKSAACRAGCTNAKVYLTSSREPSRVSRGPTAPRQGGGCLMALFPLPGDAGRAHTATGVFVSRGNRKALAGCYKSIGFRTLLLHHPTTPPIREFPTTRPRSVARECSGHIWDPAEGSDYSLGRSSLCFV